MSLCAPVLPPGCPLPPESAMLLGIPHSRPQPSWAQKAKEQQVRRSSVSPPSTCKPICSRAFIPLCPQPPHCRESSGPGPLSAATTHSPRAPSPPASLSPGPEPGRVGLQTSGLGQVSAATLLGDPSGQRAEGREGRQDHPGLLGPLLAAATPLFSPTCHQSKQTEAQSQWGRKTNPTFRCFC